ncbi:MAG: hypothetical protein DME33_03840 [Verrucomicrobia bacterium]|nr:MAG: hypothetical protein DME33_03840 [Verrucomicrobiota bacterium]
MFIASFLDESPLNARSNCGKQRAAPGSPWRAVAFAKAASPPFRKGRIAKSRFLLLRVVFKLYRDL